MSTADDEQFRRELKEEYQLLQSQYEDFDKRSLTIKGWISFASVAAIALGFDSSKNSKEIWLIVAVICTSIWYLEARWKTFQYAFSDRIRVIEAYFRQQEDVLEKPTAPFQIYHSWFKSYREDNPIYPYEEKFRPRTRAFRVLRAMFLDFVFLPYLPVIAICLGLYLRFLYWH